MNRELVNTLIRLISVFLISEVCYTSTLPAGTETNTFLQVVESDEKKLPYPVNATLSHFKSYMSLLYSNIFTLR